MIWIDSIGELEYYIGNPQWGCYSDPVFLPNDILLQARYNSPLNFSNGVQYEISILKPDGTNIETLSTGTPYFDLFHGIFTISGVQYNYTNIRCNNYSPGMLSNVCFCIELKIFDASGTVYFDKLTQKYQINQASLSMVPVSGATISGATDIIELCGVPDLSNPCAINNIKFVAIFDCIDSFSGDYYGNSQVTLPGNYGSTPFPFVKLSNINGRIRKVPKGIKRTFSINCRTQRTETTDKYLMVGDVVFPVWKMEEIENMMLANHLYVDGKEYQSEGGNIFTQFDRPYNCQYVYKLSIDLLGCLEWQIFGCSPVCESQSWYFVIP